MIPILLLHIIDQVTINLSMHYSTVGEYGRSRDTTLLRGQCCKVESDYSQHPRSSPGERNVPEILRFIHLRRCRDKPCLQGYLQTQGMTGMWGVLTKRQDVLRHDEGLGMLAVDHVPEAQKGCDECTQANRAGIIVCIDWNCEKVVGCWWCYRSS